MHASSVDQPLLDATGRVSEDDFKAHGGGLDGGEADLVGPVEVRGERISRFNRAPIRLRASRCPRLTVGFGPIFHVMEARTVAALS